MKFAYTIVFVSDLHATLDFYEKAFGLKTKFLAESQLYAELDFESSTALAFCAEGFAESQGLPFEKNRPTQKPAGIEVAFVTDDVEGAFQKAVAAGANPVKEPHTTHWGQKVSCVRDLNGVLVELCSPVG